MLRSPIQEIVLLIVGVSARTMLCHRGFADNTAWSELRCVTRMDDV